MRRSGNRSRWYGDGRRGSWRRRRRADARQDAHARQNRCRPTPCRGLSTWRSDRHREKKPTGPVECWLSGGSEPAIGATYPRGPPTRAASHPHVQAVEDPKFAEKLKDVVGLYVDPPADAVVLSVDEKSQIQALDRTQPGLPMKPGRAGTMTHELQTSRHHHAVRSPQHPRWHRHRPQHAAPSPPRVHPLPQYDRGAGPCGKSDPRHRRQLCDPQASKGAANGLRGTPAGRSTSPRPQRSWLNAVEGFFAEKLTRQRLERGVFRSVIDLQVAINRFVAETNVDPKPFVWTADPKRVLAAVKTGEANVRSESTQQAWPVVVPWASPCSAATGVLTDDIAEHWDLLRRDPRAEHIHAITAFAGRATACRMRRGTIMRVIPS